jgi:hypothetical protein
MKNYYELIKKELGQVFVNYKTTTPAFLIVIALLLNWNGSIDNEQLKYTVYVLSAAGLLGSKDIKIKKEKQNE